MAPSVFDIPALIAQFLTQREMVKCMATCRQLNAQFEPLRWQRLHVSMVHRYDLNETEEDQLFKALWKRASNPEAAAILRNRHHLRYIDISIFANAFLKNLVPKELPQSSSGSLLSGSVIPKDAALVSPCIARLLAPSPLAPRSITGLRKLHIDISHLDEWSRWRHQDVFPPTARALQLLSTNSLIADLLLPASVLVHPWAVDALIDTFERQLPCLERLAFGKNLLLSIPFNHCPPLLHALTKHRTLRELHCHFTTTFVVAKHGDYFSRNSPDLLTVPSRSLRVLTLPRSVLHAPDAMALRVLTNCVLHLQDLEVPELSIQEGSTQNPHIRMLGALNLQRLRFGQVPDAVDKPVAIMAVNACKNLTSFRAKFLHHADNLVGALDARHAETLEELILRTSGFLSSHLIHHLLCRCPRLKELSITNDFRGCGLRLRDVMDERVWACKELKILRLIIVRSIWDVDNDGKAAGEAYPTTPDAIETDLMDSGNHCAKLHRSESDPSMDGVRRLYNRIGELSKLEILELRYTGLGDRNPQEDEFERDMTLAGGLPFLSKLKSLRQLLLVSNLWLEMGQCEVEFIASNWPRLELIAFGSEAKELDWASPEVDHWEWLMKTRPEVRFVILENDSQEIHSHSSIFSLYGNSNAI